MEKLTLDMLLDRKAKLETGEKKKYFFKSEVLGGEIEVIKHKGKDIISLMAGTDEENEAAAAKANYKAILKHCPLFKEKELQEAYNIAEPTDIVMEVFDQNLGEVNKLVNFILNLYGLGEKIVEKEVEDLKN